MNPIIKSETIKQLISKYANESVYLSPIQIYQLEKINIVKILAEKNFSQDNSYFKPRFGLFI